MMKKQLKQSCRLPGPPIIRFVIPSSRTRVIYFPPSPVLLAILIFLIFSFSHFKVTANSLDLEAISPAAAGYDSPFGISGVRYPRFGNQNQAKSISYMVNSTGGSWVRGSTLIWGQIEKQKGSYDWENFDAVVLRCQADNIYLLINIAPFAHWDQGDKRGKPQDMKAFLTFWENLLNDTISTALMTCPACNGGCIIWKFSTNPWLWAIFLTARSRTFSIF